MSDTHDSGHGHEEPGVFRKYIWSTNHKTIGKQFLITSFIFLLVAGTLALSLRWQIAYPNKPVPIIGRIFFATAEDKDKEAKELKRASEAQAELEKLRREGKPISQKMEEDAKVNTGLTNIGFVKPEQFISLTTMHGLIMIFFVVIPILVGAFGNFLIPL